MKEAVAQYLEHLDRIFKVEPRYFKHSKEDDFPPFFSFTYKNIPEKGMVTGFTSGISFVDQPGGGNVRPELMVCVDTEDDLWVLALADIGYQHRGEYSFKAGDTINFNSQISKESEMTSFVSVHFRTSYSHLRSRDKLCTHHYRRVIWQSELTATLHNGSN